MSDESLLPEEQPADNAANAAATPATPPPPTPGVVDISQDKVHVHLLDKSKRVLVMKPDGLAIGRSPDNDIELNVAGVSRHHARIEFDGAGYLVRDLRSMNGTFIGKQQLTPDTPTPWLPGEELHIGDCILLLERASQGQTTTTVVPSQTQPYETVPTRPDVTPVSPPATHPTSTIQLKPVVRPDGSVIEDSQLVYSQAKTVGAYLYTPNISLNPGKPTTFSLLVINRGTTADVFRINISGIPDEWIVGRITSYSLPAGAQRDVPITVQPPRTPESKAGRHSIEIQVTSQNAPGQSVLLRPAATVAAYTQFVSELRTRQLRSGQIGQVMIQNQGNLPDTFSLTLDDKEQELAFDPPQARITIPPGGTAVVEFRASLAQQRLMGPQLSHSFGAIVNSQSGQYQPHTGEVISTGIVPNWAPVAFIVLCLITFCVAILLYNTATAPARHATQTDVARRTELASLILGTSVAQTQAALAAQNNATQTAVIATTTAAAGIMDPDADGLATALEITLGTNPNDPDSDKDGLNDGDEVNKHKTFPLLVDSDGDTLMDGDEIKKGLNPLSRDTDGDGLPDNLDPDPGHAPTHTSTFVQTPTFTPTPTPTLTPTQIPPSADLVVTVDNGTTSSVPGRTTSYTIVITNKGPSAVRNIQIEDTFSAELVNLSWSCTATAGSACQTANGTSNILVLIDLAVNGKATFFVNATIRSTASGLLSNTAIARLPAGVTETNPADNTSTDSDSLHAQVSFTLTITDNKTTISPGDATSYTIVATNGGPSAATGVSITDYFPASLNGMTWTCSASAGSACSPAGPLSGNVSVSANIMPGGTITISANGTVSTGASGEIQNVVNLASPIDPAINNRSAVDATTVIVKTDLRVTVSAPLTALNNSVYTYTVSILNVGPAAANNVILTVDLAAGATYVQTVPAAPVCTISGNSLVCNLGSLPAGATIEVKVGVKAPATSGIYSTIFEARMNETEITPADNRVTVDILIL